MAFDFTKEYREFHLPSLTPSIELLYGIAFSFFSKIDKTN